MNKNLINNFRKAPVRIKEQEVISFCKGKNVLDVGCVGQDKFFQSEGWLHKKIKLVANSLVGVDINLEWRDQFAENGYRLVGLDELHTLNEKFDVIVMGDVIEHVSNVSAFLDMYKPFLNENGKMLITTPNPFSIRQFFTVLLYGHPSVNEEHTAWLDPITLSEIFRRNGLKTDFFCWLHEYSRPPGFRNIILYPLYKLYYSVRSYYSPNFLFIVSTCE